MGDLVGSCKRLIVGMSLRTRARIGEKKKLGEREILDLDLFTSENWYVQRAWQI